jgi:hypothetical protein
VKSVSVKAGAVLFGLLLLLGSGVVASADYVAYNLPTGTMGNQVWTGSLGMDFTTTQSIIITSIGSFDNDGVGTFTGGSITAAIYYASGPLAGTQVAGSQVAFNTGTTYTLVGASVFQAITPITLSAGGTYAIVAWGYNTNDQNWNSGYYSPSSLIMNDGGGLITFGSSYYSDAAGVYPTTDDTHVYGAGTFQYTAIPIPAALWLFGPGLLGLAALRRRLKD